MANKATRRDGEGTHASSTPGHAVLRPWWKRPWPAGGIGAGALTAIAIGVAFAAAPGSEPVAEPSATPSAPLIATPDPIVTPSPLIADGVALFTVATIAVEELPVYENPGDGSATMNLSKWTYYGQPLTMLSVDGAIIEGETWHYVKLPIQPNGSGGWIREQDVTLTTTSQRINIYLDEFALEFFEGGDKVLSATIVIGTVRTPTPPGLYFVSDPLDLQANPTGVYGAYALGLSGYSEVLNEFNGGPPQIAIHGTNATNLLGTAASNGCIRVSNETVLALAGYVQPGTPVYVYETRPDHA